MKSSPGFYCEIKSHSKRIPSMYLVSFLHCPPSGEKGDKRVINTLSALRRQASFYTVGVPSLEISKVNSTLS